MATKHVTVSAFNAFKTETRNQFKATNAKLDELTALLKQSLGQTSNAQQPTSTTSKPTSSRGTSNAKSKKFEFAKSKDLAKDWKYLQEHLDGVRVDISDKKTYRLVSKTGDGRGTGRVSFSARALGFEYDPTTFTLSMPMADWNKLCDAVDNLKK